MGPGVDLPDGPSGRNPIACAQVVRQAVSEAYLVLFDDGTLGTKINEEVTPLRKSLPKSFDGSDYSMIYHSASQLSNIEFETNENKAALYILLTSFLMSISYFSLYFYDRVNSKFPEIFSMASENIFATLLLLPLVIWWFGPKLVDFSSGEIKVYPNKTDPFRFKICSKEARLFDNSIGINYIAFFALLFSGELFVELILLLCLLYMLFDGWRISKSKQVVIFRKGKRLVPVLEISEFVEEIVTVTEEKKVEEEISGSILDLLMDNESPTLEYKASMWARYKTINKIATNELVNNPKKGPNFKDPVLEDEVLHTVAAFLNTFGGTLLIGVKDKPTSWGDKPAEVFGLENDYKIMGKGQDADTYVRNVYEILNRGFGDTSTAASFVDVEIEQYEGKDICRIDVQPLPKIRDGELYIKERSDDKSEERFYVRTGTSSQKQSIQSAARYIRDNFPPPNATN